MLVGAFAYGSIVGAVSHVIATRNVKVNTFQGVLRDLHGFLTDHGFPQDLRVRLREYFKYHLCSVCALRVAFVGDEARGARRARGRGAAVGVDVARGRDSDSRLRLGVV